MAAFVQKINETLGTKKLNTSELSETKQRLA